MQIGMIGLGRMGANMVLRLLEAGHSCVVYDPQSTNRIQVREAGAQEAASLTEFIELLNPPRQIWIMVPAGIVAKIISELTPILTMDDTIIDGGNSYYKDDIVRSQQLSKHGINLLDVGTSGGVWGRERGYCLMIGGAAEPVARLTPIFQALAPGLGNIPRTANKIDEPGCAEQGYLHCGPSGAGHFVKMVHNGIEYGLMAAYSEGFNLLQHAGIGCNTQTLDAETAPLSNPEYYQYNFDLAAIAELWRRGSVITSWLLDLTAVALLQDPKLNKFNGRVSDSGEGRWTALAAIETGTPTPVLTAALYDRFLSREEGQFAHRVLSALRHQFGGHVEKNEKQDK